MPWSAVPPLAPLARLRFAGLAKVGGILVMVFPVNRVFWWRFAGGAFLLVVGWCLGIFSAGGRILLVVLGWLSFLVMVFAACVFCWWFFLVLLSPAAAWCCCLVVFCGGMWWRCFGGVPRKRTQMLRCYGNFYCFEVCHQLTCPDDPTFGT